MNNVWREYGVIGVLMVVAIGGYLYVSRHQDDILSMSLETLSGQLLDLVPVAEGRDRVAVSLTDFKQRVEANEVAPEQVEKFAASVLNLGSAGVPLNAEEAELVIQLALAEGAGLPIPGSAPSAAGLSGVSGPTGGGSGSRTPTRTPAQIAARTTAKPATDGDWDALADRLEPMMAFYSHVRSDIPPDSARASGVRFYADNGIRVVVDDRYREQLESAKAAQDLLSDRAVSWRARFADATQAERERLMIRAKRFKGMVITRPDSGAFVALDSVAILATLEHIANLRHLESLGLVGESGLDSFVFRMEADMEDLVMRSVLWAPPSAAAFIHPGDSVRAAVVVSGRPPPR